MAAENHNRFRDFLVERNKILEDIRQFLTAVLMYCLNMEDRWDFKRDDIVGITSKNLVPQLIESLCLIHGLYGYPADSETNTEHIIVNKYAVKDMLLNEIKEVTEERKTITFVDYYKNVNDGEFWQFRFSDGTSSLEGSFREPAHIFLQMVRDLFGSREKASVIGRSVLEGLPDGNWLKPIVWAEHKVRKDRYGVSLGVRRFLRPLYLYIKMNELRNVKNDNDGLKLEDVNAMIRKIMTDESEKSKYEERKDPCVSCKIFFAGFRAKKDGRFNSFANCAEYDVIRTPKLHDVLNDINEDGWKDFQTACESHFNAFNKLTRSLKNPENQTEDKIIETYYRDTRNAVILRYRWNASTHNYKLVSEPWED